MFLLKNISGKLLRPLIVHNGTTLRSFAKCRDRVKEKGKQKVQINLNELSEFINVESLEKQMLRAIDKLRNDYMANLALRSTAGCFEKLPVKFDGDEYPIEELAQISRKNPKNIVVNMSAFPTAIPAVLETIQRSGMNLNPQQDGTTLYVPIPKVTKEHRENLSKSAKMMFIKCRDNIKDVQNKFIKSVKNNDKASIDVLHNVQNQITELANKHIHDAEHIFKTKQNELIGSND